MTCGRADRVELDAFLLGGAGDPTVDSFREHYPTCAECAAAVADWMTLDDVLREVAADSGTPVSAHPEPEDLARFVEAPGRMGARAMQIENHVAGCASCGNELRLIRGFDPAIFGAPREARPAWAVAKPPTERGLGETLRDALAGFFEKLRGFDLMGPVPALAMAVVIVAGLWLSGALDGLRGAGPERDVPRIVEQPAPKAPSSSLTPPPMPDPRGAVPGIGIEPEPDSIVAQEDESLVAEAIPDDPRLEAPGAPIAPAPPVVPPQEPEAAPDRASSLAQEAPAPSPEPIELAEAEVPVEAAIPPRTNAPSDPKLPRTLPPKPAEPPTARREEVLLAAVTELPPPDYASPDAGDSVVWMRQFGAVRSAPGDARPAARAPGNHTGLTLSSQPRLWWALDKATDRPVQITIVDGDAIDPLLRVELPGPHAAGLHAFDLSKHGVRLSPDVDYRWFVSILVDPDRPSRNPVSAGSLRVAGDGDARRQTVSGADASARGNKFAELGLWYDAFDFYASLAEAHPEVERLATYRDRLVDVAKPGN